jgi:hypothetical protein
VCAKPDSSEELAGIIHRLETDVPCTSYLMNLPLEADRKPERSRGRIPVER